MADIHADKALLNAARYGKLEVLNNFFPTAAPPTVHH